MLAGQPRQHVGVDSPEGELSGLGALPRTLDVVEQPCDLRPREVRVDDEPSDLADVRLEPLRPELVAQPGGAPFLPHDGRMDRAEGLAVPEEGRLAQDSGTDR